MVASIPGCGQAEITRLRNKEKEMVAMLDDLRARRAECIRRMVDEGIKLKEIGALFGISTVTIWKIRHRLSHNKTSEARS